MSEAPDARAVRGDRWSARSGSATRNGVCSRPQTEDEVTTRKASARSSPISWAACGEVVDASRDPALRDLSRCGGLRPGWVPRAGRGERRAKRGGRRNSRGAASPALGSLRWPGALYFVGAHASPKGRSRGDHPAGHRMAALAVIAPRCGRTRGRVAAGEIPTSSGSRRRRRSIRLSAVAMSRTTTRTCR